MQRTVRDRDGPPRASTSGPGSMSDSGIHPSASPPRPSSAGTQVTALTSEYGEASSNASLSQSSLRIQGSQTTSTVLPKPINMLDGNSMPTEGRSYQTLNAGTYQSVASFSGPPSAANACGSTTMAAALRIVGSAFGSKLEANLPGRSSPEAIRPVLLHPRSPSTLVLLPVFCVNHMVLATWVGREAIVIYDHMTSMDSLGNASQTIFGYTTPPESSPPIFITAPQLARDDKECGVLLTAAIFFVVTGHPVPCDLDATLWEQMLSLLCEPLSLDEITLVQTVVNTFDPGSALVNAFITIPPRDRPTTSLSIPSFGSVTRSAHSVHRLLKTVNSAHSLFHIIGEAALREIRNASTKPANDRDQGAIRAAAEAWTILTRLQVYCAAFARRLDLADKLLGMQHDNEGTGDTLL